MRQESTASAASGYWAPKTAQLTRAGVLLAVGLAIAFTAPLHEHLGFDLWALITALALIGAATLVEYFAMRGTAESWWIAARATIALAAAGSLLAVSDSATLALVLALWAALTALITLMRLVRGVQSTRVAVPSLLLSFVLATTALVFRDDPVAVIGFFGAYGIIRGVFLGITAFDPRPAGASSDGHATAADDNHQLRNDYRNRR